MLLKFELSVEMANIIVAALGEASYRIAAPVIAELQKQAAPQMQPQLVKTEKPEPEAKQDGAS